MASRDHKLLEHLVVVATCEHELSRVKLEQAHTHRPQVHGKGVFEAEADLGRTIVARHHVRGDDGLMRPVGCAEVADLYCLEIFRNEDVVKFDIAVQHVALYHVQQPDEHLPRIHPDGCQGDAHLAPVRLEELS